ncbi:MULTISPECIES: TetR family transcriptional regulator [Mesorhizobium]|uniref:TetR family transcriptional regulator n=1 Tax=Mesorhizobium TaxID=68287 RepID=UPI002473FF94|nr:MULTISPECIES: TetR family transcriptional regulator [unclassified Mesorhizobium]
MPRDRGTVHPSAIPAARCQHWQCKKLLDAGFRTLWDSRYAAAGVRDIVAARGCPARLFTNHFTSKEAFASEEDHADGSAIADRFRGSFRQAA